MKNHSIGRRPSLMSRTSRADGSVHLNRGLRDAYDAGKAFEKTRKRMEALRRALQKRKKT